MEHEREREKKRKIGRGLVENEDAAKEVAG
jgi:hypothetical protein